MTKNAARRVVLLGAGHAHVEVLRSWAEAGPGGAELVLVTESAEAVYSGMVPGVVAGDYLSRDAAIPVEPLARLAGAELVIGRAVHVDPSRRRIEVESADGPGAALDYDFASLDVGSSVRGLDLPGVADHALATRPIGRFVAEFDRRVEGLATSARRGARIVVVGGGAAGVELAFTIEARLAAAGLDPEVAIACGAGGFLPGHAPLTRRLARREAASRRIAILDTANADAVTADGVRFGRETIAANLVVWATGAAPPLLLADSPLPRDARGFVMVEPTLEVAGTRGLFAAGDCATIRGAEWVAKAGVYAVRAGPLLDANLRAALKGEALTPFHPQRAFLALMNLGNGRALASKWGLAATGRLAWRAKDAIDRRFVARYAGDER